jgi:outer membrane receptor protein involved in Fe transport
MLTYSFYRADDNEVDYVRGDEGRFLGAPTHKVTLSETWHILKALDWNVNCFWLSQRLRQSSPYPTNEVAEMDPEFVVNTFLEYRVSRFSYGVGVANLLDEERWAPQPYAGGSGPIPLKGREYFARLAISF